MLIVVRHGVVNSGLKVLGNGQLVQRWLCHQQWKNHFPNIPDTANVPEDGATLHVQNAQNCAIYTILDFKSFFRERIFWSSKLWWNRAQLVEVKFLREKTTTWDSAIQLSVALEKSCKQCPKREPYCHRSHQFLSVGPRTPWTPGSE